MRKSCLRRFGMYLPLRSRTLTGMVTSVVLTRTTSPSPTISGSSFCGAEVCEPVDWPLLLVVAPPSTGGRAGGAGTGVPCEEAGGVLGGPEDRPRRGGRVWPCKTCTKIKSEERSVKTATDFFMSRKAPVRGMLAASQPGSGVKPLDAHGSVKMVDLN